MKTLMAAALAGVTAAVQPPVTPAQYFVTGRVELPYGNISEPYMAFVDKQNGMERLQYWGTLDTFIYRSDLNVTWQVNPVINQFDCFQTNGSVNVIQVVPDTTGYTYQGQTKFRGQPVNDFRLVVNDFSRVNTYNLYTTTDGSNTPVALSFMGYDSVFGSHYDQYLITYNNFATGPGIFPPGTFDQPTFAANGQCGPFPGTPGEGAARGQALFSELVPQGGNVAPIHPKHDAAFMEFISTYGKQYTSEKELRERHAIFTNNRRLIEASNHKAQAEGRTLRLAMNSLGDATQLERSMRRGRVYRPRPQGNGAHHVHPEPAPEALAALPTSWDWRDHGAVTEVPDQGVCGSCWAHGSTGMLEGQRYLKYGILEVLSKQEVMDCSWNYGNFACDGGEDFQAYEWIMANGGLSTKEDYGKYLQADGFCKVNSTEGRKNIPVAIQIQSYTNITSGSTAALLDALANVGPISVSVDASLPDFDFYSSGTYDNPACSNSIADLDHTIMATGWGVDASGKQFVSIRNNWSIHWGNQGYINLAVDGNICGFATAATYAALA